MKRYPILFAVLLCVGASPLLGGSPRQLQLKWSDLEPEVAGRKVALVLPDATCIEGKVIRVEPEGLRMKVTKTSDRTTQPKGEALIARRSVSVLRITRHGIAGPLIGALGAAGAVAAAIVANAPQDAEGPVVIIAPAVGAAAGIGAGIGGYYAGKAIDKKVTVIRIVP